jgi:sugar-specific transcriptional regulator TrmB
MSKLEKVSVFVEDDRVAAINALHLRAFDKLNGRYREMVRELEENNSELEDMRNRTTLEILRLQELIKSSLSAFAETSKAVIAAECGNAIRTQLVGELGRIYDEGAVLGFHAPDRFVVPADSAKSQNIHPARAKVLGPRTKPTRPTRPRRR